MAPLPTEERVQAQTLEILHYLLDEDVVDVSFRHSDGDVESDCGDTFDPVLVADKLRSVADDLNADPRFQAALTDLKQAVAQEALETAFSRGVTTLCPVPQSAEVAPEMQIIKASVALGLYLKNSCPDLRSKVQEAMAAFLNKRVGAWVTQKGGWDKVVE